MSGTLERSIILINSQSYVKFSEFYLFPLISALEYDNLTEPPPALIQPPPPRPSLMPETCEQREKWRQTALKNDAKAKP